MSDWKRGCGGHFGFINFNKPFFFQIIALKPGIYRVTASAEGYLSASTVFIKMLLKYKKAARSQLQICSWAQKLTI